MKHGLCLVIVSCLLLGCHRGPLSQRNEAPDSTAEQPPVNEVFYFEDVTEGAGLDFVHDAGNLVEYEMPSIMGSGCAAVDFDLDQKVELYLVNGTADRFGAKGSLRADGFFRESDEQFQSIFSFSRLSPRGYGMGAWWGDFDADGFPDLFLTNVGQNQLFHNQGDGTFESVTLPEGAGKHAWSTASAWADLNGDRFLDLIVVNYVNYIPGQHCEGADGRSEFCGPSAYEGMIDRILINTGSWNAGSNTVFEDRTIELGIGDQRGKGLGVVATDLNRDQRIDLYVANDMEANFLWLQQPDGTFAEQAELAGLAYNMMGEVEASMGMVYSDWNDDHIPDLFVTHLTGETNTLYMSLEPGVWRDATTELGLGPSSLNQTGFGTTLLDVEHDGDLDLAVVNGGVK